MKFSKSKEKSSFLPVSSLKSEELRSLLKCSNNKRTDRTSDRDNVPFQKIKELSVQQRKLLSQEFPDSKVYGSEFYQRNDLFSLVVKRTYLCPDCFKGRAEDSFEYDENFIDVLHFYVPSLSIKCHICGDLVAKLSQFNYIRERDRNGNLNDQKEKIVFTPQKTFYDGSCINYIDKSWVCLFNKDGKTPFGEGGMMSSGNTVCNECFEKLEREDLEDVLAERSKIKVEFSSSEPVDSLLFGFNQKIFCHICK